MSYREQKLFIFHWQGTTGELLGLSLDVPVVVGVELVVEVGQDGALHHPRPQQQGPLHQLLPLHVRRAGVD